MDQAEWDELLNRIEQAWWRLLPARPVSTARQLMDFTDRLIRKSPPDLRTGVLWRFLCDFSLRTPDWGAVFLRIMTSDLLGDLEKSELAHGLLETSYSFELPPGGRVAPSGWQWSLAPPLRRPDESARYAVVWAVELGRWTPEEAATYCLGRLEAETPTTWGGVRAHRWGEGAGDVLLAWRGAFSPAEQQRLLQVLCRHPHFLVRRVGYRAGTLLFGPSFAAPALKDEARRLREAAAVWAAKGAIDKPPPGLKELKPYPRSPSS